MMLMAGRFGLDRHRNPIQQAAALISRRPPLARMKHAPILGVIPVTSRSTDNIVRVGADYHF
jgi:hypothetical protein